MNWCKTEENAGLLVGLVSSTPLLTLTRRERESLPPANTQRDFYEGLLSI